MEEKEKLFLELIDGFEWKCDLDKYKKSLFGFKNDICFFQIYQHEGLIQQKKIIANYRFELEQDLENHDFFLNNKQIWSVFESKFNMEYDDVKSFMNGVVKKYFKMRGITTIRANSVFYTDIEKHFKIK